MYEILILKEGYSIREGPDQQKACGTITLIKGPKNTIVDTGNPWDKQLILDGLQKNGLSPEKIDFVVCTHGHSDHIGNLNLFTNSIHIVSNDICVGDSYQLHDFKQGIPYEIDDDVEVISTPGHTGADVSVVVRTHDKGIVTIAGDLFERLEDLEDYTLWQDASEYPELQLKSRMHVLHISDWIVPGHGPMFAVPHEYRQQPKMVMFEYHSRMDSDGSSSEVSSYHVIEED
ncbi:metallo-beta-lactamase domain-containing protein 1-like [Dreissena polymorpha]|uniref:Metallo-beta-lactamase domain-containing protein 1 n=1 Tax=Dreissena polymorpha TaxID=45954 RepID=A0A9D4NKI5_DREPO|nr:metallo-beta-lactamase domain-containing protein 1-like [Dreissena polymorpha]KAH3898297.1 hypothetical protein DPMN_022521 [Dreissena polymorpha]